MVPHFAFWSCKLKIETNINDSWNCYKIVGKKKRSLGNALNYRSFVVTYPAYVVRSDLVNNLTVTLKRIFILFRNAASCVLPRFTAKVVTRRLIKMLKNTQCWLLWHKIFFTSLIDKHDHNILYTVTPFIWIFTRIFLNLLRQVTTSISNESCNLMIVMAYISFTLTLSMGKI